jgi:hypothetical protein
MTNKNLLLGIPISLAGLLTSIASVFADVLRGEKFSVGPAQYAVALLGFLVFLLGLGIVKKSYPHQFLYGLSIIIFVPGIILLFLNIYGQFVSLRNPAIYNGFLYEGRLRIPDTPEDVYPLLKQKTGETSQDFAYRLTQVTYDATVHYWDQSDNYTEYHHRIPIYENFLLWWAYPKNYEFCNPYKAIERGVSVCSQASKIIIHVWKQNGLKGKEVTLDGHVIVEAFVGRDSQNNRVDWVLDGDLGVVFEQGMAFLQEHPDVVKSGYLQAGYPESLAEKMAGIYGPSGNYVITSAGYCEEEALFYQLKWVLPLGSIWPLLLFTLLKIRGKRFGNTP